MTAGAAAGFALVGFLCTLILVAMGEMVSEEVRGRLERLPHTLIALAARWAPTEVRAELHDEWVAELHEILRGAEALPLTRLVIGTRFAVGQLSTARMYRQLFPAHGQVHTSWNWVPTIVRLTKENLAPGVVSFAVVFFGVVGGVGVVSAVVFSGVFAVVFSGVLDEAEDDGNVERSRRP